MTLTEFLLARIAEDEAVARNTEDVQGSRIGSWRLAPAYRPTNLVAYHPARVLAECEAKRRIVGDESDGAALYAVHERGLWPDELTRWADQVLATLALPYADHPDYQQEWRP